MTLMMILVTINIILMILVIVKIMMVVRIKILMTSAQTAIALPGNFAFWIA